MLRPSTNVRLQKYKKYYHNWVVIKKIKEKIFQLLHTAPEEGPSKKLPEAVRVVVGHTRRQEGKDKSTQNSLSAETHGRASLNRVTPKLHRRKTGIGGCRRHFIHPHAKLPRNFNN
jgi:hypothetical protein